MIIHVVMDFSRLKIGSTLWNGLHTSNNFLFKFLFFSMHLILMPLNGLEKDNFKLFILRILHVRSKKGCHGRR
jgi:hypothetical protein